MIDGIALKGKRVIILTTLQHPNAKTTTQQPYEHRKKTIRCGILDKHKHGHRRYNKELLNIPWISTDKAQKTKQNKTR